MASAKVMKRGLATILAIGSLGILCVFLLSRLEDHRGAGVLQAAAPTRPAEIESGDRPANPADRPAERATETHRDVVTGPEPAPPATAADPSVEPPPENGIEILVRWRENKEPAAHARISFLEWNDLDRAASSEYQSGRQWEAVERFGRTFEADEAGLAIVPRPREYALVSVSLGGGYARLQLKRQDTGRRVLELEPDRELRARVLDARSAPVGGQRVALRALRGVYVEDAILAFSRPEDGIAVLPHVQAAQQERRGLEFVAGLVLLGREPVQTKIDPGALPLDPIDLVLPECGSLALHVDRADGTPGEEPVNFQISRVRTQLDGDSPSSVISHTAPSGQTTVSGIELGLDLRIRAWSPTLGSASKNLPGPRQAGEVVDVRLLMSARSAVLTGRTLVEDGTPLAGAALRASVGFERENGGFNGAASRIRTDDQGRFRFPVQGWKPQDSLRSSLILAVWDVGKTPLEGSVPIDIASVQDEADLGDVYLIAPPLLAAGRVVDSVGRGIPGAVVTLVATEEQPADVGLLQHLGYAQDVTGVTDGSGAFELRGKTNVTALEIRGDHTDYAPPEPQSIARGASQLLLVMRASGRIAGRLLVDDRVPFTSLAVVAIDSRGEAAGESAAVGSDGRFEIRSLEQGLYSVVPRLREEAGDLARVDGIAAEPLRTTEDPALDPIDLRGRIQRFVIAVHDRHGKRIRWFQVRRRASGEPDFGAPAWWSGREDYALFTARNAVDLLVSAEEYRTTEIDGVDSDRTVTLGAGIQVELVFAEELRRFAEERTVGVLLQCALDTSLPAFVEVGAEGRATTHVGMPGRHSVEFYLEHGDDYLVVGEELHLAIDVADTGELQSFTLALPAEELERTRRELQGE